MILAKVLVNQVFYEVVSTWCLIYYEAYLEEDDARSPGSYIYAGLSALHCPAHQIRLASVVGFRSAES